MGWGIDWKQGNMRGQGNKMEPIIQPETKTNCPNTGGDHQWVWDEDRQDWFCDECGVSESNQEEEASE